MSGGPGGGPTIPFGVDYLVWSRRFYAIRQLEWLDRHRAIRWVITHAPKTRTWYAKTVLDASYPDMSGF